jgi:hypothetical protein
LKEITYRTKVLLHRTMDIGAYMRQHPKIIQRAVISCLKRARLCTEKRGRHFEQLYDMSRKM